MIHLIKKWFSKLRKPSAEEEKLKLPICVEGGVHSVFIELSLWQEYMKSGETNFFAFAEKNDLDVTLKYVFTNNKEAKQG